MTSIQDRTRWTNGILAALAALLFFLHAALGCLFALGIVSNLIAFMVWIAIGIAGLHVITCVITSFQMLNDKVRPPSVRKKRHLVLKWVTGVLILLVAGMHMGIGMGLWKMAWPISLLMDIALVICLAWHTFVGVKSLLKDLNINRRYRTVLRIVICTLAGIYVVALICGIVTFI